MKSKGVNFPQLTKAQIRDGNGGVVLDTLTDTQRAKRCSRTRRCGSTSCARPSSTAASCAGVGARIVAETFHRAIEGSTLLDRPRPRVAADARAGQHDVPDGRPAAVRVRGQEDAAGAGRLVRDPGSSPAAASRGPPGCRARACRRAPRAGPRARAGPSRARRRRRRRRRRRPRPSRAPLRALDASPTRASRCAYFATLASASETTK